jgi:hypothetical protein
MKGRKSKISTIIIIVVTLILAGVAVFTAMRLYQLRQTSVTPLAPSSRPEAATTCTLDAKTCPDGTSVGRVAPNCDFAPCPGGDVPASSCSLSFTLTAETPSPSPSPTGSPTVSPTPTPTSPPAATPNSCNGTCGSNFNCQSNLVCYQGFCRNPSCTSETDCTCSTAVAPTPAPSLPESGTNWPTIVGTGLGIFVIIGALLLAL